MKYRKKPVVIEAVQLIDGCQTLLDELTEFSYVVHINDKGKMFLHIDTLEGNMLANEGDYIIKGIQGELYPCKPDIFEQTYEALDD